MLLLGGKGYRNKKSEIEKGRGDMFEREGKRGWKGGNIGYLRMREVGWRERGIRKSEKSFLKRYIH